MIDVLVADDHEDVRRRLIRLIGGADDIRVVAEAADGVEVLALAETIAVDVVLLDLTMPRKGGLETLRELLSRHPDAKILIVSMHPAEQLAERMVRTGARGYVGKDQVVECLQEAIRTVHRGGIYLGGPEQATTIPAPRLPEREAVSGLG